MKQFCAILIFIFLYKCNAYGDTIPFRFETRDGKVRCGKIVRPERNDMNILVIQVNHRMLRSEVNGDKYLLERLLSAGISYCLFDNRPLHSEDSTSMPTLFDMADEAVAVYNELRENALLNKYKIGFVGSSESGASALISAAKVKKPDFLIQLVTNVNPQDKKDLQILTYTQQLWIRYFISDNGFGMQFHDASALHQVILDDIKHSRIGDVNEYLKQLYMGHKGKIANNKDEGMFTYLLASFLNRYVNTDGNASRLWWNAEPYYKLVKCPILFLSAKDDDKVLCAPNIVAFEKMMHENQNSNYTTVIVDATHNLLDGYQDYVLSSGQDKVIDYSKRKSIDERVVRWILNTVGHVNK